MISAVALLDVDKETMLKMMGDVDMLEHHIIHCLGNLRGIVDAGAVPVMNTIV